MQTVISLPMKNPTITSYPGRANLYSIIESRENCRSWLMENFIQTESLYRQETDQFDIDFFIIPQLHYSSHTGIEPQSAFCPYLRFNVLDSSYIDDHYESHIDCLLEWISRGYYVTLTLDVSRISVYKIDKGFAHNIFIFGYNKDRKIFEIADFFNRRYSLSTCTFDEMNCAIESIKNIKNVKVLDTADDINTFIFIKINEEYQHIFDITRFKMQLNDYLSNTCVCRDIYGITNRWNSSENQYRLFGNMHFDNMVKYLLEHNISKTSIHNFRAFHIAFDHKKAMLQRLVYLFHNQYLHQNSLIVKYEKIVHNCLLIRNKVMKSAISNDFEDINNLCKKILNTKQEESDVLNELISCL